MIVGKTGNKLNLCGNDSTEGSIIYYASQIVTLLLDRQFFKVNRSKLLL